MKRLFLFLLALLLALPLTVACGKKQPEPAGTNESGSTTTAKQTPVTQPPDDDYNPNILDTLPAKTYGGKNFKIALQNNLTYQFDADEINGSLVNDAIYNWLQTVSTRYDTDISFKENGDWNTFYANLGVDVMGGVDDLNLYGGMAWQVSRAILNGYYRDWNSLNSEMIDLNAKRWDNYLNNSVTYNGKLFAATGDLGVSKLQYAIATFYNVELLGNNNVSSEDLYEMVDTMTWTFDEFEKIVKDLYFDTDNDGTKSAGDTFGYYSNSGNSYDIWFPSFGIEITSRDAENTITPTLYTESNVNVLQRLCNFYETNVGVFSGKTKSTSEVTKFANGQAAMVSVPFYNAYNTFQEMGTSAYGILPAPMLNTEQGRYITKLNDQYCIWGISRALPETELDFTAHITDALCAECSETVYYQYYDVALKKRYSKDPDTARMVDVVMSNVSFDTAIQFGEALAKGEGVASEGYPYIIRNMIRSNQTNLSSVYDGIAVKLAENLQTVYNCYQ